MVSFVQMHERDVAVRANDARARLPRVAARDAPSAGGARRHKSIVGRRRSVGYVDVGRVGRVAAARPAASHLQPVGVAAVRGSVEAGDLLSSVHFIIGPTKLKKIGVSPVLSTTTFFKHDLEQPREGG